MDASVSWKSWYSIISIWTSIWEYINKSVYYALINVVSETRISIINLSHWHAVWRHFLYQLAKIPIIINFAEKTAWLQKPLKLILLAYYIRVTVSWYYVKRKTLLDLNSIFLNVSLKLSLKLLPPCGIIIFQFNSNYTLSTLLEKYKQQSFDALINENKSSCKAASLYDKKRLHSVN